MKNLKESLLLYAVTDRRWLHGRTLISCVEEVLKGGATMIQLREKTLDRTSFEKEAQEVLMLCHQYEVPLIINNDVELAAKVDADGVHVGQSDESAAIARRILGQDKIIGVTARTVEQAGRAVADGADYLGCGAVFSTGTKTDTSPLSLTGLKEICSSVPVPAVAIGGIKEVNAELLKGTGIAGVAAVGALFSASDITEATSRLKEKIRNVVHETVDEDS